MVPAGVITVEEPTPASVVGTLPGPSLAVVTAPVKPSSLPELEAIVSPTGSAAEDEPAIEVVDGGVPVPSDDAPD